MAAKRGEIGLKQFLMGPIANDGGMGTNLIELGPTVSDTAQLVDEDGQKNDLNVEEYDVPFDTFITPGKSTITLSVYDVDPPSLVRVFGGTATVDPSGNSIYEAPRVAPVLEQSVRLITRRNGIVDVPRVNVSAKKQFNFKKTAGWQVDLTLDILLPTKENVGPLKYTRPA